jgi:hypothetical protein
MSLEKFLVVAGVGIGLLSLTKPVAGGGGSPPLPTEPVPMTDLPIISLFASEILEPFALRNAPTPMVGRGRVEFQDGNLLYVNDAGWTLIATRTPILETVEILFVWKALEGDEFICEGWNGYPNGNGHSAFIYFKNKKVYHVHDGDQKFVYLMDLDPTEDWVTVQMLVDYSVPEIVSVTINDRTFEHLPIGNEPIGKADYWQLNFRQNMKGQVLIKAMKAW